jgi:hypothetical protein
VDDNHPLTETIEGERETARFVALFILGVILFSPLLIAIFDVRGAYVFGIPLLYAYLFASWAFLIALSAWLAGKIALPAQTKARSSPAADG